jgi:Arc/MetJ-type ribon-helix-helix transcriptional regulator
MVGQRARINLPLTVELLARIDAALRSDEYRVDFVRDAIKRELERREAERVVTQSCARRRANSKPAGALIELRYPRNASRQPLPLSFAVWRYS